MKQILNGYSRLLEWIIGILLLALVVLVFTNVVLRYVFNSGLVLTEEMGRWLFVWLVFLGAVVGVKERAHLGSDLIVSRLKPGGRRVCAVLSLGASLYVTWLLFTGSYQQVMINLDVGAPVSDIPMSVLYASCLVFSVSSAVYLLRDFWLVISGKLSDQDLVMVHESEEIATPHGHAGQTPEKEQA